MASARPDPRHPTVKELRARVRSCETELKDTIDQLNDVLQGVVDWKQKVEKHPMRFALGAAAMGLAVGLKPSFIPAAGGRGLQAVLGFGLNAVIKQIKNRFF